MSEPDHRIELRFDQDSVHLEAVCHAREDADCRLVGPEGCTCTSYAIERADERSRPYHRVDTVGGAEILHWMKDGGECNVCLWLNESGDVAELNAEREQFLIAAMPVEPIWDGDHYKWKRTKK